MKMWQSVAAVLPREPYQSERQTWSALAVHVLHAEVHLALGVAKDAQFQNLGQQLVALGFGITLLSADQHQQALTDLPDRLPRHADTGMEHTLHD